MSKSLGLLRIDSLHYYVRDLARSRELFVDKLDFAEVGTSTPQLEEEGRQRSVAFRAGDATFVFIEPLGKGGRAWRFLNKHPEGVGTVVFEVEDAEAAFGISKWGTWGCGVPKFRVHHAHHTLRYVSYIHKGSFTSPPHTHHTPPAAARRRKTPRA